METCLKEPVYMNCGYFGGAKSHKIIIMLGNPSAHPGKNITHPLCYSNGNVHFEWFNQYSCTGEYFQSDLDIFPFGFMFVNNSCFYYNSSSFERVRVVKMRCYNQNLISVCTLKHSNGSNGRVRFLTRGPYEFFDDKGNGLRFANPARAMN